MYGKLINGIIVFVPRHIPMGEYVVYNPTPEMLVEAGYKPVIYTDPSETEPGWITVPGWTETADEIVQTWTVEPEGDISDAEALDILLGGEGQ